MREIRTSGSVGAVGGNPHGHPTVRAHYPLGYSRASGDRKTLPIRGTSSGPAEYRRHSV